MKKVLCFLTIFAMLVIVASAHANNPELDGTTEIIVTIQQNYFTFFEKST